MQWLSPRTGLILSSFKCPLYTIESFSRFSPLNWDDSLRAALGCIITYYSCHYYVLLNMLLRHYYVLLRFPNYRCPRGVGIIAWSTRMGRLGTMNISDLPIITVMMAITLLPIITRSIIGNNGFIIAYY